MGKIVHVLGNGDKADLYEQEERVGTKILCNMPPFELDPKEVYATCMVDFKMMMALTAGEINLDRYRWV